MFASATTRGRFSTPAFVNVEIILVLFDPAPLSEKTKPSDSDDACEAAVAVPSIVAVSKALTDISPDVVVTPGLGKALVKVTIATDHTGVDSPRRK